MGELHFSFWRASFEALLQLKNHIACFTHPAGKKWQRKTPRGSYHCSLREQREAAFSGRPLQLHKPAVAAEESGSACVCLATKHGSAFAGGWKGSSWPWGMAGTQLAHLTAPGASQVTGGTKGGMLSCTESTSLCPANKGQCGWQGDHGLQLIFGR